MKKLSFLIIALFLGSVTTQLSAYSFDNVLMVGDTIEPEDVPPPPRKPAPRKEKDKEKVENIFQVVEEMPRFPGCEEVGTSNADKKKCADKKMLEYIYKSIKYPTVARQNNVQGVVVVSFIIEKDGTITGAKIIREIGGGCGEEVLRIINDMNNLPEKWRPGQQRGQAVRVQFNLPVRFRLEGKDALQALTPKLTPAVIKGCEDKKGMEGIICTRAQVQKLVEAEMKYPEKSLKKGVEGTVVVRVIIAKDGTLKKPEILRGLDKRCNKEAIRIVKTLPNFEPAQKGDKAIPSTYDIIIEFKIEG